MWLFDLFGLAKKADVSKAWAKYAKASNEMSAMEAELHKLRNHVTSLKTELMIAGQRKQLPHPVVEVFVKDPEPSDTVKRKSYVAQVAGFHNDVMKPKLVAMISDARSQFEKITRETYGYSQEEFDIFLKGTINGLWTIHDWGETMVNEQVSYQNPEEDFSEEDREKLKAKLN